MTHTRISTPPPTSYEKGNTEGKVPFVVYAEIAGSVSVHPVFGLALDGILASVIRKTTNYPDVYASFQQYTGEIGECQQNYHCGETFDVASFSYACDDFFYHSETTNGVQFLYNNNNSSTNTTSTIHGNNESHEDRESNQGGGGGGVLRPSVTDEGLGTPHPALVPLPLGICWEDVTKWHWACSSSTLLNSAMKSVPVSQGNVEYNYHTMRLKENQMFASNVFVPKTLGGTKGRYKNRRKPVLVSTAQYVAWTAYGYPNTVLDLLSTVSYLGDSHTRGEGRVLSWNVDFGDTFHVPNVHSSQVEQREKGNKNSNIASDASVLHYHSAPVAADRVSEEKVSEPQFIPGRCLPERCIVRNGFVDVNRLEQDTCFAHITCGIRPPFFHPAHMTDLLHYSPPSHG